MTGFGVHWRDLVNTVIDENSHQARCGDVRSGTELNLRVS
jgi:hypothetical protein